MQVVDRKTGKTITVPDEQVQAGFQAGAYALPKGSLIPIQRGDGEVGTVPAEGLNAELAAGGSVIPQDQYDKAAAQAKYGGPGGMAEAAGLGLLRGATAGLSDVAIAKIGGEGARKEVQGVKTGNPYISGGSELTGAVAPALLGDEAGVAGLAGKAGEAADVADVARGGLEAGEGLRTADTAATLGSDARTLTPEARFATGPGVTTEDIAAQARAAAGAAGEAAPIAPDALGAAQGLAPEVDTAALAKEPGVAGRVAQIGLQGLTAPARGIAATGRLAERLIGSVVGDNSPSLLARTAQRALATAGAGAVENALYQVGDQVSEDVLGDKDITAEKLAAAAGHGALFGAALGGGLGAAGELGSAAFSRIARSDTLEKISNTQAWRSLNPNKPITREVDKFVKGGHEGIGKRLLDDGVLQPGDTIDDIAPRITQQKAQAFAEQNQLLGELKDAGAKGVDFDALKNDIVNTVPDIIKKLGDTTGVAKTVDRELTSLEILRAGEGTGEDAGRVSLEDLNNYRKYLDDRIHWEQSQSYTKNVSPETAQLQKIRATIERHFIDQADRETARLSGSLPGKWAEDYKAAKLKTQQYIMADKSAAQAISAKYANQAASLTDKMAGFAAGGSGFMGRGLAQAGAHGLAHGAAGIAGGLGHVALGVGATYAAKYVREHGNSTVAVLLRKARELGAVQQVVKRVDGRIASEVDKAVSGHPYRGGPPKLGDYDQIADRVRKAQGQIAHDGAVNAHLGDLKDVAPKVSGAFGGTVRRATMLLATKLPKQAQYTPLGPKFPPTDTEKADLLRTARVVEDPLVILKDFRAGTLTPGAVAVVKNVYPNLFDELQKKMVAEIKSGKEIPYSRKLAMGRLFGIDVDGTMNPQFVQHMQSLFVAQGGKSPGGGKPGKTGGSHHAANLKSKMPQNMTLGSRVAGPSFGVQL